MRTHWAASLFLLVVAVVSTVANPSVVNLVVGVFLVALALVIAPLTGALLFPRSVTSAQAVQASQQDGRPIIYWRPGCPFCLRLRATVRAEASKALWVNIWDDPEGAAAVRAVADGNETVPTVVWGSDVHVNPDPEWVRARLTSAP
ncbi:glutaredoxin family protein [Kineosporia babensis]|uniref:Glutaredoxin domain-containing protein n=1 Tax=Kineosporia babensis TaxID=499548 RepID=A0A9X1NMM0_9ACTN|nr:glutaredoxin domain-containing protein [Kineosporia babensis]MCD5315888.1 hypothetical protein [Kineosporia babensis]